MATTTVVSSSEAYAKALLHCYKYPTQAILGMLIGKHPGTTDNSCYVCDAIPLFHTVPMTAPHPMVDVAFAHVHSAAKTKGLSVLGVYIANERLDDHALSPRVRPLLDYLLSRLASGGNRLLVWMIDNTTLTAAPASLSITPFFYDSGAVYDKVERPCEMDVSVGKQLAFGRWNSETLTSEATVSEEMALQALHDALDAFAQYRLVDFEEHLENPQLNYLKQSLSSLSKK